MRKKLLLPLIGITAILAAQSASAQMGSPNTTPGAVVRVSQIRIKPGRTDAFWADMRQHLVPIYEKYKASGIISDYTISTKATTEGDDDWNVSIGLLYPNWAALDTFTARTDPIALAHYGSAANRTAATMARLENGVIVNSYLIRRQTVNPWK